MSNSCRTVYLRVSEGLVMLVEVHVLETQSDHGCWFEDKHLQEAVQIVREAIELRQTQKSSGKGGQQSSAIITGDSLRLGYIFKTRPGSQHCIVPSSCLTVEEQKEFEDGDLHSLAVAKDKLIIYACQRQVGSPQGMSQLVRVLGEKTNSSTKGVSISSYFQKVTGKTKSGSISASTSPTSTVSKCPGKRNILKKIIQKSDTNVSNKRKKLTKAHSSRRESTIHQFLNKDKTASQAENMTESLGVNSANNNIEITGTEMAKMTVESENPKSSIESTISAIQNEDGISKSKVEVALTDKTLRPKTELSTSKNEQNTVRISQVFNTSMPLNKEETYPVGSVTLISVDQMQEIQQQKLAASQILSKSPGSDIALADTGSDAQAVVLDQHRDLPGLDLDESVLPSASFISQTGPSMQSPSVSLRINENNGNWTGKQSPIAVLNTDSLSDSADSPVFSRKKSETTLPNILADDQMSKNKGIGGERESNCDSSLVHLESQIPCKSGLVPESSNSHKSRVGKENRLKKKLPNLSETDVDKDVKESSQSSDKVKFTGSQRHSQENIRSKRKLPNFSDSDSDENGLPSISRKQKPPNKKKFVTLNEMNRNAKKFSISKSFFTGKDEKLQPTLSFFMSDTAKKKKRNDKTDVTESELNKEELDNLDCTLIEELSAAVKVKCEIDAEIKREIKELRDVDELNEEHLSYMVRTSEPYLRDIFEGKIHSSRHIAYKKGGKSKRDLNYASCLKLYSEEQIDTVMEALMRIFCKRHHKYLDYIMKVLLPEMLIKFHMEIHNMSKEESERKLMA